MNKVRIFIWVSLYCKWGEGQICLNMCFYDKSSKEASQVLRFKWETPLKIFWSLVNNFTMPKMPFFM